MSSDQPPARARGLASAAVDGETVVYDPAGDALHLLDAAATAVWDLIDGRSPAAAVAAQLAASYAGGETQIHRDVHALVEQLRAAGLVVDAAPSAPRSAAPPGTARGDTAQPGTARGDTAQPGIPQPGVAQPGTRLAAEVGRYRALDHEFSVEADDPVLGAQLAAILGDLAHPDGDGSRTYHVRRRPRGYVVELDGEPISTPVTRERLPRVLLWHVNQEAVGRSSHRLVLLHAAVAEHDGAAVMLPAGTERGKTTTVAGLVRAGYRYLSDEIAAVDPRTLRLQPYPKPLSVDPGSQGVLADLRPSGAIPGGAWQVPASAVRPDAIGEACQPRLVIAPEYQAGGTSALAPLSRGRMMVHLADTTFGFRDHASRNLTILARLVSMCHCYRLVVSDLEDAVRLIDRALAAALVQPAHEAPAETQPA